MPRTLVIGRSPFADVVVADATVAPHHLELVIADDGRLHATDCATAAGSWRLEPGAATSGETDGDWVRIRQVFVTAETQLRLGEYRCTVTDLLVRARQRPSTAAGPGDHPGDPVRYTGRPTDPPRGRVERDAATGEIVRRRP